MQRDATAHHLLPDVSDSSTAIATEEDEEGGLSPLDTWRTASSETNSNVIYSSSDIQVGARPLALPRRTSTEPPASDDRGKPRFFAAASSRPHFRK
jgi:hypothetical protein